MLAEFADLDRYVVSAIHGGGDSDRTEARRWHGPGLLNATRQFVDHTDQTIREGENDGDQRNPDDQLPNIRQATGEIGARDLDAQRSDDGTDDGAATARARP